MSDLISRQAAIDEAYSIVIDGEKYDVVQVETLMGLPSAQPEIIRCKDCKNWDTTWQNDWPKNYHYCPFIDGTRNGDWYCADAERRNTEEKND